MLDILKSYIDKDDYYIITLKNKIYIQNYTKIMEINHEQILLEIDSKIYKIYGENLFLSKSTNKELEIKGTVKGINII